VIPAPDVKSVYEIPLVFAREGMDQLIVDLLRLPLGDTDLRQWTALINKMYSAREAVTIGIVGKYVGLEDSYKSLNEALIHGGFANNVKVNFRWIESEELMTDERWEERLREVDAILVPGGFGKRGISGMIRAISFARRDKKPFFGICLGMQCASLEYARNVADIELADSTEFDSDTPEPVIFKLRDLLGVDALGGTMRLGAYPCNLVPGSLAETIYQSPEISERHRHRYEFNPAYENKLAENGLIFSGKSPDGKFVEIVELADHPWFLACQFHPELKSKPLAPHPLFISFIKAAYEHRLRDEAGDDATPRLIDGETAMQSGS
jgi:CTP synthase